MGVKVRIFKAEDGTRTYIASTGKGSKPKVAMATSVPVSERKGVVAKLLADIGPEPV
jgi:hypothetical protein